MKKILGLLKKVAIVFVVLIALAAIFGGGGEEKEATDSKAQEQTAQEQAADDAGEQAAQEQEASQDEKADEVPSIAKDSKYAVTINDSRIVNDYDGAPCIAVDYTFTNVSDDSPTSMQLATNITVYQDGVECEDAWFADDNSDGYTNKVKAGVSVDVTRVYKLQNTTSDVEIEVAPLFSWNDDLLAYQVYKLS